MTRVKTATRLSPHALVRKHKMGGQPSHACHLPPLEGSQSSTAKTQIRTDSSLNIARFANQPFCLFEQKGRAERACRAKHVGRSSDERCLPCGTCSACERAVCALPARPWRQRARAHTHAHTCTHTHTHTCAHIHRQMHAQHTHCA